jgi:hypothetical protein
MTMRECDIWLTARVLIECYGDNAEIEAALRYRRASQEGNLNCFKVWKCVQAAVISLRYGASGTDVQAH